MSNYLSHIAAKQLNLTEVVHPRLASRFEPTAVSGSGELEHNSVLEVTSNQNQSPIDRASGDRLLPESAPPLLPAPPVQPHSLIPPSVLPSLPPRPPAPPPVSPITSKIVPQAALPQAPHSRIPPLPTEPVAPLTASPAVPPQPSQPRFAAVPSPAIAPQPQSQLPLAPRPVPPAPVQLNIPPHLAPPAAHPAATSSPAAPVAPTIQVSIGRIEVRAIVPAKPPRPPVQPYTPSVTLEQYLGHQHPSAHRRGGTP
jgi:hypothetical protein